MPHWRSILNRMPDHFTLLLLDRPFITAVDRHLKTHKFICQPFKNDCKTQQAVTTISVNATLDTVYFPHMLLSSTLTVASTPPSLSIFNTRQKDHRSPPPKHPFFHTQPSSSPLVCIQRSSDRGVCVVTEDPVNLEVGCFTDLQEV